MNEEQTSLCSKLTRLSAFFALLLPLGILIAENALMSTGATNIELSTVLSYISLVSTAFSGAILYFGARRLDFRQSYVLAVFPVAANVLMAVGAMNVMSASSGSDGLPSSYICCAYLRLAALPFLTLWLCGLWSKPLKKEALYVAVSVFVTYVLSSLTNYLVGGLLPASIDLVRSAPLPFGKLFLYDTLAEVAGYVLLRLIFRKKSAADD